MYILLKERTICEIMSYMKVLYKRLSCIMIFLFNLGILYAQNVSEGVRLFTENQPAKAIPLLEKELKGANPSVELYNYLGLAYSQIGDFQKACDTFERGLGILGTNKKVLYFNQGNAYYRLEDYQKALNCYSMSIVCDADFAEPYLNRANTNLKLNNIDDCISDYTTFLELKPNDVQEPKIRELLDLLHREKEVRLAEEKRRQEEAERLKQEEERLAAAKAEQERIASAKRAEEEERRRQLLEEVANSLKQSSDTTNMSAGAEDVLSYDEESDID